MTICIIPARLGSRRIKNKNIKLFFGHPIIKYSIDAALQSKLFKEIIISTESNKIKKIAKKFGASLPFLRPKKLANDITPIKKVLLYTLKRLKKKSSLPDYFCLIYATAPFINKKDIIKAYFILKKSKADGICTVCRYNLPIQRALIVSKKKFLKFIYKKYSQKRSQDLPQSYYDAATFSWFKTKNYLQKKANNLKILPYLLKNSKVQDIDTLEDWILAENKYKILKK